MSKVIVIDKCSICPNTDHKGLKVNKTTEVLKLAEEAAEFARNICLGMNWSTDLPDEALAAIREALADSKPAPDGRIPKTVFTLDDISKAAEIGRQAGMIDALAEPVKPQKERQDFIDGYTAGMADAKRMQANAEPVKQEPVAWYDKIKGMEVSVDVSTGEDDDTHRIFGRVSGVMLQSCGAQDDIILAIEDSRNFTTPPTTPNLNCKSVQRRLATSWGYVRKEEYDMAMVAAAKQQEPVARFNWNEGKFEWLTKYDYYKHHMKPLYLMPPTAAQAARQMRDTAVKKVRYLASLIPLNGQMHTIQIEALLDAASSIAALPIEGEEK